MKKKPIILSLFFLLFFSLSYYYFLDQYTSGALAFLQRKFITKNLSEDGSINEPKTEQCPLNGALYGKTQRSLWEGRRPLGIMIENSVDSRPQSGLTSADVVFEAVAEGGITRFLAIYYCQDTQVIGPVRSARVYFMDFVAGFGNDVLYAHVGGANTPGPADALGQIEKEGWAGYNDLNQFSIGFPAFWRDYERLPGVAVEHTMYTNSQKLWEVAAKRGLTNKNKKGQTWDKGFQKWEFEEDIAISNRPQKQQIKFGFWENYANFNVVWNYDQNNNLYLRSNGGKQHFDKNTESQIFTKNVVVLFMDESVANDGYEAGEHMLYGTTGTGEALVFKNGKVHKATWSKEDRYSQLRIYDLQDKEIKFVAGPIWFEVVPVGNRVQY